MPFSYKNFIETCSSSSTRKNNNFVHRKVKKSENRTLFYQRNHILTACLMIVH